MPEIKLILGDCLDVLPTLPADSVDACVTDPPAGIAFMGKDWDNPDTFPTRDRGALPGGHTPQQTPHKHTRGFANGVRWDKSTRARDAFIAFLTERLAGCLRVAKPGSVLLCWAMPRTSHWTGTAIEEAGWQIEDRIAHHFGSGFPKHRSKLKPATEDWWLARKPGGAKWLGVERCRVETGGESRRINTNPGIKGNNFGNHCYESMSHETRHTTAGRWPANLLLSHAPGCNGTCVEGCPIRLMGEQGGERASGKASAGGHRRNDSLGDTASGWGMRQDQDAGHLYGDSGSAARFFANFDAEPYDPFIYVPKASRKDRNEGCEGLPPDPGRRKGDGELSEVSRGNNHPTVKSTDLMRWLCRLATPPGGTILDCFSGSGSTGKAAILEGFSFIGIEQDPEAHAIAEARIAVTRDIYPLFAGLRD